VLDPHFFKELSRMIINRHVCARDDLDGRHEFGTPSFVNRVTEVSDQKPDILGTSYPFCARANSDRRSLVRGQYIVWLCWENSLR
jgi:hypothetical protein